MMEEMNDAALNPQELAEIARERAAFYAFLNVHFTTLPDVAFVERMRNQELTSVLEALVKDETVEGEISAGASLMRAFLEQAAGEAPDRLVERLGVDRTRLYRGVTPKYGPPPPYEMVWSKTGQDVSLLTALAGIYREKGLAASPDAKERLDYIGVEMDFVRELALREAAAWDSGDAETARGLIEAQRLFLRQHLGDWTPPFIEKALEFAGTDFYKGHLLMLRGFLADEQHKLELLVEETGAEEALAEGI